MCQNEKIISCEVAYLPLGGKTADHIDEILDMISHSGLDFEVGTYRTIIKGGFDAVMALIKALYQKADAFGDFVIDVRLSNVCGY